MENKEANIDWGETLLKRLTRLRKSFTSRLKTSLGLRDKMNIIRDGIKTQDEAETHMTTLEPRLDNLRFQESMVPYQPTNLTTNSPHVPGWIVTMNDVETSLRKDYHLHDLEMAVNCLRSRLGSEAKKSNRSFK